MQISFDGIRIRLAEHLNALAGTPLTSDQRDILLSMRELVAAMLLMYDPVDEADGNNLSDAVALEEIPYIEDEDDDDEDDEDEGVGVTITDGDETKI